MLYKCSGSTEEQTDLSFLLHVCDLSDTLPAVTDQTVVCDGILHCLRHLVFYVLLEQNTRKHQLITRPRCAFRCFTRITDLKTASH